MSNSRIDCIDICKRCGKSIKCNILSLCEDCLKLQSTYKS